MASRALLALQGADLGTINRDSTREDIDQLRSAQKRQNGTVRHVGDWERRA
jgi:hypothetical protein